MQGDVPSPAQGNGDYKVSQDHEIKRGITHQAVGNGQKNSQGNQGRPENGSVEFITLFTGILGKQTNANDDIGDNDQNGG